MPRCHEARLPPRSGIGRALVEAVERDARRLGRTGVTTVGFRDLPGAEWFLPAAFFEHLGYEPVDERGRAVLLWKLFSDRARRPRFLAPAYVFEPIPGKVVVDLFWNDFCQTSSIEAQRVRDVRTELPGCVVLREFRADDREVLHAREIERGTYVNGREISWGYEASKAGIRKAIEDALAAA